MKTKPILITAIIALLAGTTLFIRCKTAQKADAAEITKFLYKFNSSIKTGNNDSLMSCFQADKKAKALNGLIKLLAGGIGNRIPEIDFDVENAKIKNINTEIIAVSVPAHFKHPQLDGRESTLPLKIYQVAPHQYKIVQADGRKFYNDYLAYEDYVKSKVLTDKDIYSASTLAAFKTANQLKAKYDSVIWFAHLGEKTYYYVVKGKWNINKDMDKEAYLSRDSVVEPYKMGLVGPDLKEIIPADYDLIHNINATFPNLVEVEKDNKRGFYDLDGKIAVPVAYDQVFPIEDEVNLAVLQTGDDYFYLKKDLSISGKVDIKINDFFSKIKNLTNSFNLYKNALAVVTEYNSRDNHAAVYLPPSYLVDMNMASKYEDFKNPLRKADYEEVSENYNVGYSGTSKEDGNWFTASFYSIRDYFLGGRSEFYDRKNLVIVDKKRNKVFTQNLDTEFAPTDQDEDSGGGSLEGACNVNDIKVINDSLFEVKSGTILDFELYDSTKTVVGGPFYHYLTIKNNKLVELPESRNFNFTKYVKMDDSYLVACYNMAVGINAYNSPKSNIDHVTPEMLRYMKNEIFADYKYKFKDKRWQSVFAGIPQTDKDGNEIAQKYNANVDDSLTVIDKYNINWISQKLKALNSKSNTVAVR